MDTVLLIITLVSLLAALTMSVVTWRVVREDRRRSAARVAEIASELGYTTRPAEPAVPSPFASAAATDAERDAHDAMPKTPVADLFALAERLPVRWQPIGLALLGGLVVSGIALAGASLLRDSGGSNMVATVAASPPPLELVALRHSREGDTLTVSGLVRNPSTGSIMRRVMAVVFMFDRRGDFAGSGRAQLELATLAPGNEAPFLIRTQDDPAIGRYRVSFRNEEGAVLPHIDRRP